MMLDLFWMGPFGLLLLAIAVLPLTHKAWWEKCFGVICLGLAALVSVRYLLFLPAFELWLHAAREYLSFVILLGSLFIISSGIYIRMEGRTSPLFNCFFLGFAALSANVIGTMGASMIFIQPWLRMNQGRIAGFHIVFFIFLVSNIGGGLTPIGDPPLFLGYLRGVPFFWVLKNVWPIWCLALIVLLGLFFILDGMHSRKRCEVVSSSIAGIEIQGKKNFIFLFMILASAFVGNFFGAREGIMIAAAILSYFSTSKQIHKNNHFSFAPIKEVAILFAGIFFTLIPVLEYFENHARDLGIETPGQIFWMSGLASAVLDNAPTYLNFLSIITGLFPHPPGSAPTEFLLAKYPAYICALSVSTVFFGAMTYIGNGPNLLVKAVAEQQGMKTPGFFTYILYSLIILLPLYLLLWILYFR